MNKQKRSEDEINEVLQELELMRSKLYEDHQFPSDEVEHDGSLTHRDIGNMVEVISEDLKEFELEDRYEENLEYLMHGILWLNGVDKSKKYILRNYFEDTNHFC